MHRYAPMETSCFSPAEIDTDGIYASMEAPLMYSVLFCTQHSASFARMPCTPSIACAVPRLGRGASSGYSSADRFSMS